MAEQRAAKRPRPMALYEEVEARKKMLESRNVFIGFHIDKWLEMMERLGLNSIGLVTHILHVHDEHCPSCKIMSQNEANRKKQAMNNTTVSLLAASVDDFSQLAEKNLHHPETETSRQQSSVAQETFPDDELNRNGNCDTGQMDVDLGSTEQLVLKEEPVWEDDYTVTIATIAQKDTRTDNQSDVVVPVGQAWMSPPSASLTNEVETNNNEYISEEESCGDETNHTEDTGWYQDDIERFIEKSKKQKNIGLTNVQVKKEKKDEQIDIFPAEETDIYTQQYSQNPESEIKIKVEQLSSDEENSLLEKEHSRHTKEHSHHIKEHSHHTKEHSQHTKEHSQHTKEHSQHTKEHSQHANEHSQHTKEHSQHTKEHSQHTKEHSQHWKEHSVLEKEQSDFCFETPSEQSIDNSPKEYTSNSESCSLVKIENVEDEYMSPIIDESLNQSEYYFTVKNSFMPLVKTRKGQHALKFKNKVKKQRGQTQNKSVTSFNAESDKQNGKVPVIDKNLGKKSTIENKKRTFVKPVWKTLRQPQSASVKKYDFRKSQELSTVDLNSDPSDIFNSDPSDIFNSDPSDIFITVKMPGTTKNIDYEISSISEKAESSSHLGVGQGLLGSRPKRDITLDLSNSGGGTSLLSNPQFNKDGGISDPYQAGNPIKRFSKSLLDNSAIKSSKISLPTGSSPVSFDTSSLSGSHISRSGTSLLSGSHMSSSGASLLSGSHMSSSGTSLLSGSHTSRSGTSLLSGSHALNSSDPSVLVGSKVSSSGTSLLSGGHISCCATSSFGSSPVSSSISLLSGNRISSSGQSLLSSTASKSHSSGDNKSIFTNIKTSILGNTLHKRMTEEEIDKITASILNSSAFYHHEFSQTRNSPHVEPITDEDIDRLFECNQLGIDTPQSIINTLWIYITIFFRVLPDEHRNLCWGDIILGYDMETNTEYLEFNKNEDQFDDKPRMYATPENIERCPVYIYKLYQNKRPPQFNDSTHPFYLAPCTMQNPGPADRWFVRLPFGNHKFKVMQKKVAKEAYFPEFTDKLLTTERLMKDLSKPVYYS